jgi:hypothetical protein
VATVGIPLDTTHCRHLQKHTPLSAMCKLSRPFRRGGRVLHHRAGVTRTFSKCQPQAHGRLHLGPNCAIGGAWGYACCASWVSAVEAQVMSDITISALRALLPSLVLQRSRRMHGRLRGNQSKQAPRSGHWCAGRLFLFPRWRLRARAEWANKRTPATQMAACRRGASGNMGASWQLQQAAIDSGKQCTLYLLHGRQPPMIDEWAGRQ